MATGYKGFTLNQPGDALPWGSVEYQAWQDIINTVVEDCVEETIYTAGHRHFKLYAPTSKELAVEVVDGGDVGVGITSFTPASMLEILSDSADPVLTITGKLDTDLSPQIQFRTDATPTAKFSIGVVGTTDNLNIYHGSGIVSTPGFVIDTDGKIGIKTIPHTDWKLGAGGIDYCVIEFSKGSSTQNAAIHSYNGDMYLLNNAYNSEADSRYNYYSTALANRMYMSASSCYLQAAPSGTAGDEVLWTNATANSFLVASGIGTHVNFNGGDHDFVVHANGIANALIVQGSDGFVGMGAGAAVPVSQLEIHSSIADPILSITAAHADLYDPQVQFRSDVTDGIKCSIGTDSGDSDKFKIYMGAGIGGTTEFAIASGGKIGIGITPGDPMVSIYSATAVNALNITKANAGNVLFVEGQSASVDEIVLIGQLSTTWSGVTQLKLRNILTGANTWNFLQCYNDPDESGDYDSLVVEIDGLGGSYFAGSMGIGKVATCKLDVDGAIASATLTLTAAGPTDNLDVSGVNTIIIDTNANNVILGGTVGGVAGQLLAVVIHDSTNDTTIEHAEGTGNQDFYLHKGADETLNSEFGGWMFVNMGGNHWHDCSHAQHVG
jgi:hypothetical protein